MKKILLILTSAMLSLSIFAQTGTISGTIKDAETGETLIGANVLIKAGVGTVTDYNGKFSLQVDPGQYNLTISYVGYKTINKKIEVTAGKTLTLNVSLKTIILNEVTIVADIARARETPVAFTNVLPAKIEEELGSQDMPMILNSTPGVYATQTGGGDGDAEIRIRGFRNNNIGTMLDGIPVNDMETGRVYWSNWFGLDMVTRAMQVQRGLGASKLALPSVGGTINIITKGINDKKQISFKQQLTSEGKSQTSVGYNSGLLSNGFGFTIAASYKDGPGWVEATETKAFFGYLKVYKRFKTHTITFSAMDAPQIHEQRAYKKPIAMYDSSYAKDLGIKTKDFPTDRPLNLGYNYNQHWGYLRRDRFNPNAEQEKLHERINEYQKPMFSIRDFWSVNEKLSISNILYLSIGKGGGTSFEGTTHTDQNLDSLGQINWQSFYSANTDSIYGAFGLQSTPIDTFYSDTEFKSRNIIYEMVNEHFWVGYLSTFDYKFSSMLTFSGGLDLRRYKGTHYSKIYDLLGGDYFIDKSDQRIDFNQNRHLAIKRKGDKIFWYDDAYVNWGGAFFQAEYKTGNLTSFINLTGYYTGHRKDDYFHNASSDWKWIPGFTFKTGANYNLTEHQNVFANLGYLSKVKVAKYVYKGHSPSYQDDLSNEKVMAFELGYSLHYQKFATNLNLYHTRWINMPLTIYSRDPETEKSTIGNVMNMEKRHQGIELDMIYKVSSKIELNGLFSLGDWIWNKKIDELIMYDTKNTDIPLDTINFDVRGIHSGDAAQTQFAFSLRYKPIKKVYIKARYTYFDRYFSDFNAEECQDEEGNPKESWQIPAYSYIDIYAGYNFKISVLKDVRFTFTLSAYNILDQMFITDAKNNDSYINAPVENGFDARSASVFFGRGRNFSTSLKISF